MPSKFQFPIKISAVTCIFIILSLFVAGKGSAQLSTNCCFTKYSNENIDSVSVDNLSLEYKRLKKRKCDECSNWRSGLHIVMTELSKRLDGKNKADIRRILGRPDTKKENQWIYEWRDGHDYLFFEFSDGRGKSNWYYAYE